MRTFGRRDTLRHLVWTTLAACAPGRRALVAAPDSQSSPGVTLVRNGRATSAIFVPASVMASQTVKTSTAAATEAEDQRRRLRDSVLDLACAFEKISGAGVEIVTGVPATGDTRVPIWVGDLALRTFGGPGIRAPFKQGFRLVVSAKGVGLLGESDLATSYAIYELLFRLGCRWFMPSEMGEVLPSRTTIVLPEVDFSSAPSTTYRGVWYADDAYRRRNRHGGFPLAIAQVLETYVSQEDRARHPEWVARIGGRPDPARLRWSPPGLASRIADELLARFEKNPERSYSLSPADGFEFDSSTDESALDGGDLDPTVQRVSLTDRLLVLCNRIAARVTARAPDVLLGMLAYAQYTRAPVRETVHPSIVPSIAPILYSRFHPMRDDAVPDNRALRDLVVGWGKAARQTSFYAYGYNLAEPTAPQPMLAKWAFDVPFVLANGCKFWQPETLPNYETHMQALYMANRLAWNANERALDVIEEIHRLFYGHAAGPMAAYWSFVDDVWVKTPEYAGCAFTYLRRWTPERLKRARTLLNEGREACVTPMEARRVQLAVDSLELFELFMKMRRDLAEGRFHDLGHDASAWRRRVLELADRYREQQCFSATYWARETVGGLFFRQFFQRTYEDAASIAADFDVLTPSPLRQFPLAAGPRPGGRTPRLGEERLRRSHVEDDRRVRGDLVDPWPPRLLPVDVVPGRGHRSGPADRGETRHVPVARGDGREREAVRQWPAGSVRRRARPEARVRGILCARFV